MAEEIKIVVKQESVGTALSETAARIETLKKEIGELNRLSTFRSQNGDQMGAGYARQDAARLTTELRGVEREHAGYVKARATEERAITKEHREQAALGKARGAFASRVANAGESLVERAAGATPLSGLTSALTGGGPIGMLIKAAVVAAVAGANFYFGEKRKDRADEIDIATAHGGAVHERNKRARFGNASGAAAAVEADDDARNKNLRERAALEEDARPRWYDPRNWSNNVLGTGFQTVAGARALKRNAEEGARLDREKKEDDDLRQKKIAEEIAPEIRAQQLRNAGHAREARGLEDKALRHREYMRLLHETYGDEGMANEGADAKLRSVQWERMGSFAGLLNARSGAADVARVAGLSRESRGDSDAILRMHTDMNRNHQSAETSMTLTRFSRLKEQ